MKPDDEKFLKDLAWSELWFPWKRSSRVILGCGGDGMESVLTRH